MRYLRAMTFNVQLLPDIPFTSSPGNEAASRASAIGEAIAALPAEELPDIIAFNEVFNEDGRDVLLGHLKPLYSHIIEKLDDCFLGQDSGLMLVSRYPFLHLPSSLNPQHSNEVLFFSYGDSADTDRLTCKGVGVVQIKSPLGVVTVAFSHTQAYYSSEDQYSDIRRAQMKDTEKTISRVIGPPPNPAWNSVIVMGDFNIRRALPCSRANTALNVR